MSKLIFVEKVTEHTVHLNVHGTISTSISGLLDARRICESPSTPASAESDGREPVLATSEPRTARLARRPDKIMAL